MILLAQQMFDMEHGRYSMLTLPNETRYWIMEREWNWNKRNVSCVPRGTYELERHHSRKYPNTWAIVGGTVSHFESGPGFRFACVLHRAVYPTDLEGCVCACRSVGSHGMAIDSERAMSELLAYLEHEDNHTLVLA